MSIKVADGSGLPIDGVKVLRFVGSDGVSEVGDGEALIELPSGGSLPDPFVVTGTDPEAVAAQIEGAPDQAEAVLKVLSEAGGSELITVTTDGEGGPYLVELNGLDALASVGAGQVLLQAGTALILKPPLAEPSDALLNQFGQVIVWTTNTAGAAKLHFKMLDSNEAVVKGEIALS